MVKTGDYLILYYNRLGTKLRGFKDYAETLTDAKEMAEETLLLEKDVCSYTVDRRLYNSMDIHE